MKVAATRIDPCKFMEAVGWYFLVLTLPSHELQNSVQVLDTTY